MKIVYLTFLLALSPVYSMKVNDLGFLYPLNLEIDQYLMLKDISKDYQISKLPPQLLDAKNRFFVIALKFEPCSQETTKSDCVYQIRFVLQNTFRNISGRPLFKDKLNLQDNALHVFYDLSKSEYIKLVKHSSKFNKNNTNWIHQLFHSKKKTKKFHKKIVKTIKNKKPSLITAMIGDGVASWKFFKIFPKQTIESEIDIFSVFGHNTNRLSLTELECMSRFRDGCKSIIDPIMKKIQIIENPKLTHVNSIDCASCHIPEAFKASAHYSRSKYTEAFTDLGLKKYYLNTLNSHEKIYHPANMRHLGYFGNDQSISTRVRNELKLALIRTNSLLEGTSLSWLISFIL